MSETDKTVWNRVSETMQRKDFLLSNWIWVAIGLGALILLVIIIAVAVALGSKHKKQRLAAMYSRDQQLLTRIPPGFGIGRNDMRNLGASSTSLPYAPAPPGTAQTVYTTPSPMPSPALYRGTPQARPIVQTEYSAMPATPSVDEGYGYIPSPQQMSPGLVPSYQPSADTLRARSQYGAPTLPTSPPTLPPPPLQYTNIPFQPPAARKLPPKPLPAIPSGSTQATGQVRGGQGQPPVPVPRPTAPSQLQSAAESPYGLWSPEPVTGNPQYQLRPGAYQRQ